MRLQNSFVSFVQFKLPSLKCKGVVKCNQNNLSRKVQLFWKCVGEITESEKCPIIFQMCETAECQGDQSNLVSKI